MDYKGDVAIYVDCGKCKGKKVQTYKNQGQGFCYESPKKETVSHAFKHLIQNLKSYNEVKV